jgi:hypothetical protein
MENFGELLVARLDEDSLLQALFRLFHAVLEEPFKPCGHNGKTPTFPPLPAPQSNAPAS